MAWWASLFALWDRRGGVFAAVEVKCLAHFRRPGGSTVATSAEMA